jgi:NTP pyrophosphatase (non-canonical NTP hydrolase)
MDFDTYQEKASETAMYPSEMAIVYLSLGMASEAGEVAGKLKKVIRDKNNVLTEESAAQLIDEAGDVLWYISQLARELGYDLSEVADRNIKKLRSRIERGKISGSGDNR